jgi:hypothetical protein
VSSGKDFPFACMGSDSGLPVSGSKKSRILLQIITLKQDKPSMIPFSSEKQK